MKLVALAVYSTILSVSLSAQSAISVPAHNENLYAIALEASLIQMEKAWGYMDQSSDGSRIQTDYRHVIVEKNPALTNDLPSSFADRAVEYLDHKGLIDRCKKLKKPFAVLKINPMRNEGDKLVINISVSWVMFRKGGLWFEISDWSNVEFNYDCEQRAFVRASVKLGGI
jgi:hypothetical protein